MKKILLVLFVVSAIGATSCKKEAETVPVKSLKVNGGPNNNANKLDTNTWD
ncbi:MAG TPA: hypothetical protein VL125_14150 [Pelobium sp.]|nr:hypothetical protein [Pelobium sp.]